MRVPSRDDPELWDAIQRYVTPRVDGSPRYLRLGYGLDRLQGAAREQFLAQLARDARTATDRELHSLLDSEWRSRKTAAWLIGVDRRTQFRERIGGLLLASELVYAGQGYCFALARFATAADCEVISTYLDTYLAQLDKRYDQTWALGALLHIDARLGTQNAGRFLTDGGLWQLWRRAEGQPEEYQALIDRLCAAAAECMSGG